ncbi:rhodanese-like domain-containing protein [Hymenobacter properus]|uniref:Rhodanese-like domain-containing protein n=1 Tax=Hymenobacter properus TaxID=2791026 RepID=A0A931FHW1_9BACT|nr:rhodanese-like domain-containing protein [Hymenobacter properus]MBF9140113.1 rhodanese-like domain-containing protein [Hymenobacter properus]MBR7718920.1 rhodanese-like domain-containing protein [Microvirga sp. SRT04]
MYLPLIACSCLCLGMFGLSSCGSGETSRPAGSSSAYDHMLRLLYKHTVPTVAPATLAHELSAPTAPLLLDARTPAEYAVSHLRGAELVPYDSVPTAEFPGVDRRRPVVVYCSVGYRSERLGDRLWALGFAHVRNLYGGLFEWVNEGYPVENAAGPTANVHPYSALWGAWLKRGRKAYK